MAFNWNRFAYTNFHELNLDWFNEHFKEIFEEWEELYNTLTQWKDDTDADLAAWKTETLAAMDSWENDLLDALNTWKQETGEDIEEWESGVISDLNDWKQEFLDAYEELEDRVETIFSDTEDMVENLAEPFSTSTSYNAGDYVIYNGLLYTFTTDHAAGAWIGTDVRQTTALNVITDLKKAINTVDLNWQSGGMYQASGIEFTDSNRSRTPFIVVSPGETVYIEKDSSLVNFALFEFASNTTTSSGTNEKLAFYSVGYNDKSFYTVGSSTHYIRLQANYPLANVVGKVTVSRLRSPLEAVIERFSPSFVTPSMFADQTINTDAKMIQAAVNYAFAHRCDVAFDRMYTLNSSEYILLNKYNSVSADRYITRFFGIGGAKNNPSTSEMIGAGITKKNSGNIFVTNSAYKYSGDFIFENLTFESETGAGCNVFDLSTLMYLTVTGCFFKNVDSVARNAASSDARTKYWQAITFKDSTIVGGKGYAFYGTGCYVTKFENLIIEHRDGGIKFDASLSPNDYYFRCRNLVIQNCCIEGNHGEFIRTVEDNTPSNGVAISIDNPVSVLISGCYFESNYKNIVLRNAGTGALYSADIRDCWLSGYFYKERYGTISSYDEIVDDKYIVTISGDSGHYQIEKCATERGGVVNAPANQDGITILYLGNVLDDTAKGEMDYSSFTYDSDSGTWTGSSPINNTSVVTGGNNNQNKCKTYSVINMT